MLNILVTEVGLQGPGIVALVGQRKAAGVPKHMGMSAKAEFCGLSSALYQLAEHG
jgi:hypothetical protein